MTRIAISTGDAGSAGKSTTTVSLAAIWAEQGRRVVVIDADPQGTSSGWLGAERSEATSLGEVLERRISLIDALQPASVEGVQVVASSVELAETVIRLSSTPGGEQRLRVALDKAALGDDTVVLVDCPGDGGLMTYSALLACEHVLGVARPIGKEIRGLPVLERMIADAEENYGRAATLAGVLSCEVPAQNAGSIYQTGLESVARYYGELVAPPVRRSARVAEAISGMVPLPVWAPTEAVTEDYRAVAQWLSDRGIV